MSLSVNPRKINKEKIERDFSIVYIWIIRDLRSLQRRGSGS
jgi:hypothetical protein